MKASSTRAENVGTNTFRLPSTCFNIMLMFIHALRKSGPFFALLLPQTSQCQCNLLAEEEAIIVCGIVVNQIFIGHAISNSSALQYHSNYKQLFVSNSHLMSSIIVLFFHILNIYTRLLVHTYIQ